MRKINIDTITKTINQLCVQANISLRKDVLTMLKNAHHAETNSRAKNILKAIIDNARIARKERLAICQDTGLPCVLVEIGQDIKISGDLKRAINRGIELGYKRANLRNSIVRDPLLRTSPKYSPAVIHIDLIKGNKLKLTVLPKGFGCENKTQLKMFNPTAPIEAIKKFIVDVVKNAGPDACPPFIVGVGIGGTADYAMYLAKKALLKKIQNPKSKIQNKSKIPNPKIHRLEKELYLQINKLNIGPMGLGGKTTALAVNIETYPTHIAGLPVAVNISCHALRSAAKIL